MDSWFLSTLRPWPLALGLIVLIAGVALLYRAWRQPSRSWPLVSLGWIALLLVHWPLGLALGVDRGWAMAAILPGFVALLWIAMTTPWRNWQPANRQPLRSAKVSEPSLSTARVDVRQTGKLLMQLLVVGVLSFTAALGVALAVFAALDTSIVNRTVYAALVVMLLWPAFMVWSNAKNSLLKPALWFMGISAGGWLFTPALF